MFPQTPHIECVALLEKSAVQRPAASASPPGSTPRSRGRWPSAARSSATTRSGPTTTPAPRAWRRWPSSAPPPPRLDLGVAVIALDRTPPETIAADIERLGLDPARLWLGVGAGFSEKPLTRMRESLPELRERLPGVRLVLAAMGPKMCALAGAEFDGVFFNWMTPEFAAGAREQGRGRRPRGRPRHAARSSATSAPPSAPTPPSAWPRRSPSTATSTTATATTSTASASPRAPSASPPPTPRRPADARRLHRPRHGVVRGLASDRRGDGCRCSAAASAETDGAPSNGRISMPANEPGIRPREGTPSVPAL